MGCHRFELPVTIAIRVAAASVLALVFSVPCLAQGKVVEMVLSAASEPVPALKYCLRTPLREQTPGNAALHYHRALLLLPDALGSKESQESQGRIGKWNSTPLAALPIADVEKELARYRNSLIACERGARCAHCDWQIPIQQDGVATTMPEIQHMRVVARALELTARSKIAKGEFASAVQSFQTALQLGRHLNDGSTVICGLVGAAVAAIMFEEVETFVQQPAAPNLYWALTDLPTPYLDFHESFESEGLLLEREFPQLARFRAQPLPEGVARDLTDEFLERWVKLGSMFPENWPRTLEAARFRFLQTALALLPVAKRHLIEDGRSPDEVAAMPAQQIVILELDRRWNVTNDNFRKWTNVTEPYRSEAWAREEQALREANKASWTVPLNVDEFRPALSQASSAALRRDRQIAMVRVVEAIRIHLAQGDGRLPASLDEITAVPVPLNPATGQPFAYSLENAVATLDGGDFGRLAVRYVLRVHP